MKRILEFDDFVSNLSLTKVEQEEIKDFVSKYEKDMNFQDAGQFDDSIEALTNDVMTHFNFPATKKEDVQNFIQSLQTLTDELSVIMSPGPEVIYRTNPDMTQTVVF